MTTLFLNYRTEDDPYGVALLDRELSARFGSDTVFRASKSIPPGDDWAKTMFQAVADSAALLAIIGRRWLKAKRNGKRCLDLEDDYVRREILTAFSLGKRVIPVRLGVPRLSAADLPPELSALAGKQDVDIRFRSSGIDVDRLADDLAKLIPELSVPGSSQPAETPAPTAANSDADTKGDRSTFKNVRVRDGFIVGGDANGASWRRG